MAEPKHTGGGWYELADGRRIQGKEAAYEAAGETPDEVALEAIVNIPASRSPYGRRIDRGTKFKADPATAEVLRAKEYAR